MGISNPNPSQFAGTTGTYTGDTTQNRAIPHGLGRVPDVVFINKSDGEHFQRILGNPGTLLLEINIGSNHAVTVTAMDSTNFYVGDAGANSYAANSNSHTFYWVAIG